MKAADFLLLLAGVTSCCDDEERKTEMERIMDVDILFLQQGPESCLVQFRHLSGMSRYDHCPCPDQPVVPAYKPGTAYNRSPEYLPPVVSTSAPAVVSTSASLPAKESEKKSEETSVREVAIIVSTICLTLISVLGGIAGLIRRYYKSSSRSPPEDPESDIEMDVLPTVVKLAGLVNPQSQSLVSFD